MSSQVKTVKQWSLSPFRPVGVPGAGWGKKIEERKEELKFLVQFYFLFNWLLTKLRGVTSAVFWKYSDFIRNLKAKNDKYMLSRYEKVNKTNPTFLKPTADIRNNLTMDKIMPLNCNSYFYFRTKYTKTSLYALRKQYGPLEKIDWF